MITTKTLIETHLNRYPDMRVDDFIKLFYQNSFGPKHMSSVPDEEVLHAYIVNELDAFKPNVQSVDVEAIGHGFVRVSLSVIVKGRTTPKALAAAFKRTMDASAGVTEKTKSRFLCQIKTLLAMHDAGDITLQDEDPHQMVETYVNGPLAPIRHSEAYRRQYHPHYRVLNVQEAELLFKDDAEEDAHEQTC